MKLRVILTGATGMVGEGVLHECLQHPEVEKVLVIGRRSCQVNHPKLREIVHKDLYNLFEIEDNLIGYNTCLFCLGTTSVGKKEPEFFKITYELTIHVASTLSRLNHDMCFCYISGAGTDSTENKKTMWARVKGKTENDLMKLPFKSVYNFRPGILKPTAGLKNTLGFYKWLGWMIPLIKLFGPNSISTLKELGLAMISVSANGYKKNIIEVSDIHAIAKKEKKV
jgi:hypothetical protein